jgi:hypothetical protein
MSKIALANTGSSYGIVRQLIAFIDDLLMKSAQISIRNGDLPRFGL